MKRCRVIGYVVANAKHSVLNAQKIMVVKPEGDGPMQLAVDGVGAGIGSLVLVSESGTLVVRSLDGNIRRRSVIVGIMTERKSMKLSR